MLDAGCGDGRNIRYLLSRGFVCYGVDRDPVAVEQVRRLAAALAPGSPGVALPGAALDKLPWPDASVDAVICSAVLHFATTPSTSAAWCVRCGACWRPAACSSRAWPRTSAWSRWWDQAAAASACPTAPTRFIVDEAMLMDVDRTPDGRLADPLKTTVVQGMRSMTTWSVTKG